MLETLGDLIRRRMRELGIRSNAELARRLQLSASYVGDLINDVGKTKTGKYIPSPVIVSGLSKHLHIAESEILARIGYNVESTERIELLEGVTIQFDRSADLSETDKKQILDAVRLIAAGVRAEHESGGNQ